MNNNQNNNQQSNRTGQPGQNPTGQAPRKEDLKNQGNKTGSGSSDYSSNSDKR